tara:strand:+ start:1666 stop:1854 length:189 start_codon:yes stop_codon:yes gene_type:complete
LKKFHLLRNIRQRKIPNEEISQTNHQYLIAKGGKKKRLNRPIREPPTTMFTISFIKFDIFLL